LAALAVDEVMDVCQDILTKCPQDKDEEVKKAKRLEYAAGKMKSLFDLLGQRAEESSSGWLCGSDMTVAGVPTPRMFNSRVRPSIVPMKP
jgi:hypothetical protein